MVVLIFGAYTTSVHKYLFITSGLASCISTLHQSMMLFIIFEEPNLCSGRCHSIVPRVTCFCYCSFVQAGRMNIKLSQIDRVVLKLVVAMVSLKRLIFRYLLHGAVTVTQDVISMSSTFTLHYIGCRLNIECDSRSPSPRLKC